MKTHLSMASATGIAFVLALISVPAWAQEASIKRILEERTGISIESVAKTKYLGLYEVRTADMQVLYTDEKVNYIFNGTIHDGKTLDNLTDAVKFSELPPANAFNIVRGNGKRHLAYFSDPNCPYCRQLEKELAKLEDVTLHVYLYPILNPPDSVLKSKAVWCSTDRLKVWNDLMLNGVAPSGSTTCNNPIERNLALGKRLRVNSVPTLVFADGKRVSGMRPAAQLAKFLDEGEK